MTPINNEMRCPQSSLSSDQWSKADEKKIHLLRLRKAEQVEPSEPSA